MTRAVADRLGGFNEELATGEDTDFVFRANRAGIPVWGVPSLQVIHYGEPATLGAWFRQQLWHANRKSYKHIARLSGAGGGGNAPLFTVLYALTLGVGLVAAIGSLITNQTALLAGCLPWLGLVVGPAALMSKRGRNWRHFAALCLLYAVYGWARTVDLLGLHPVKASWKGGAPR
jgi:hypothetical protein